MTAVRRLRLRRLAVAVALVAVAILAVAAWRARPLPPAPPHAWASPSPSTPANAAPAPNAAAPVAAPAGLSACWLELGRRRAPAGASRAGWAHADAWDVTVAGLLVRHPRGDVLIDVGNSAHFADEIAELGPWGRLFMRLGPGSVPVLAHIPDALAAVAEPLGRLRAVVISHLHPDHAGGIVDLPGVPVLLDAEELGFARRFAHGRGRETIPATARAAAARGQAIAFTARPYAIFDESYDLFGDGAVVLVRLPGHTPGSIGTFVTLSPTRRLFHVGDAVNSVEAIEARVTKSLAMAWTDFDPEAADAMVARLAQLHARDPGLAILPAHDRPAWEGVFGPTPRCLASTD